jgi:hypothetical protein
MPRGQQPCPIHKVRLQTGGARVVVDGLAPLGGHSMADYFRLLPRTFPLANAVRVRGSTGRIRGRMRSSYCPECRRALQKWCESAVAAKSPEAWLARLMLDELFGETAAA